MAWGDKAMEMEWKSIFPIQDSMTINESKGLINAKIVSAALFQAHVKSLRHFQFLHHVFQLFTGHVHGSVRPQRFGKTQAEIIDVRNNHRLGSGLLADGGSHAADNPGSRNQDVLAYQIPGQSRMDGVAQRVKNGGDFHRNALVDAHHVILRNGKVLRKAAGPVDSHTLCVGTQVLLP